MYAIAYWRLGAIGMLKIVWGLVLLVQSGALALHLAESKLALSASSIALIAYTGSLLLVCTSSFPSS